MTDRIDLASRTTFLTGPADALVAAIVTELRAVPQWTSVFVNIESYKRMDFPMRELPSLRVYSERMRKDSESWFVDGTVTLDVILPASLRREETHRVQDVLTSALIQQFRRPSFLAAMRENVAGLNELGKVFEADKSLGFDFGRDGADVVPLTQINLNFRVDLREWDEFLEWDARTKDDPFVRTLEDLEGISTVIQALRDSTEVDAVLPFDTETL